MFRKLAVALGAPLLLVTACATEGEGAVQVKTGAEAVSALRAAPDAAADAGTAKFEMVMEMAMLGESFELVATGAFDAEAERMALSMDLGSMFEQLAESTGEPIPDGFDGAMEMVADGSTFYMRAPMFEMITGTSGWLSMAPEDLGTTAEGLGIGAGAYDPAQILESLRGIVGEPAPVGEELVRGVATTHYSAVMDLALALDEAPADQRELLEATFEQFGDLDAETPVDIWLDGDGLPRRLQMDMGSALGAAMGAGEDVGMVVTMEFFDYGEPVDIVVPSQDEVTPFTDVMGDLDSDLTS